MPNQERTPKVSVRIPPDLWQAVLVKARGDGETRTAVLIRLLTRYVRGDFD